MEVNNETSEIVLEIINFPFFPTLLKAGSMSFEHAKGIQNYALLHLLLKTVMWILGIVRHFKDDMRMSQSQ